MRLCWLALVGALSAASCGLLSHDPASVPFPSDGTTAFGETSPVELCLGTARVIAPAVAPGGPAAVCVREGSRAQSCASEADCGGIEHCICGRCIVQACQGAASCAAGEVCRGKRCTLLCGSDGDCPAGERCAAGGCARACSRDGDCFYGESCDSLDGVCATSMCSAAVGCGSGDVCEPEQVIGEPHEPDLVTLGGTSFAFVEIRIGGESAVYRARFDSPSRFTAEPPSPVLTHELGLGAPSALVRGAAVELFARLGDGLAIVRATSSDSGVTFARDESPVLEPAEAWEQGRVGSPSAFEWAGARYLAYEGGRGAGIGLAKLEASSAQRIGEGPIALPETVADPVFWRSVSEIGAPFALVTGDVLRIYVTARGAEGSDANTADGPLPADVNDSIGLLAGTDLSSFDAFPTGPVLARLTNLRAYLGEREVAVRLLEAGAEAVFVTADAAGNVSGLGRAGPAP